jgi:IS1 family transposase
LHGDQYAFLAIERNSKLILHWEVGKRTESVAREFLRGLKDRVDGQFQLTSDGFPAYANKGRGVGLVFGDKIDYGVELKQYAAPPCFGRYTPRRERPVKLQWIRRISKIGNPDRRKMTVNHMERQNLSIRLFNRRFTRKTLGYSKILRNHRLALALQIAHFDFCRVHSAHNQTPAMAASLTDHPWTVAELLAHQSNNP